MEVVSIYLMNLFPQKSELEVHEGWVVLNTPALPFLGCWGREFKAYNVSKFGWSINAAWTQKIGRWFWCL